MAAAVKCTMSLLFVLGFAVSLASAHKFVESGLERSELEQLVPGLKGVPAAQKLRQYLTHYGYLPTGSHNAGDNDETAQIGEDAFDEELSKALTEFERFHGLPQSPGALNSETIEKLMAPRCGVPDIVQHGSANSRFLYDAKYSKWPKTRLTWAIDPSQLTPDMSMSMMITQTQAAFAEWARVTPLTFSQAADLASADIKIRFRTGDHGDGAAFTAPNFNGMTAAAHAFFPPVGELHLNGRFTWNVNAFAGLDLQTIVLHELGHSLGLGHTNIKTAVMYPTVTANAMHRTLDADDINGIQSRYGKRPVTTPRVIPSTAKSPPPKKPPPPPPKSSQPWWKFWSLRRVSRNAYKPPPPPPTQQPTKNSVRRRHGRHRKLVEDRGGEDVLLSSHIAPIWWSLAEGLRALGAVKVVALTTSGGAHDPVLTLTGGVN